MYFKDRSKKNHRRSFFFCSITSITFIQTKNISIDLILFSTPLNVICKKIEMKMKRKLFYLAFILIGGTLLTSCSHRLVGTWNVASYETETQGQQSIKLNNIGTMTFRSNNRGEKNLNYQIFQITREDNLPFRWLASDQFVTIDGNKEQSDFVKTWIIVENKRKFQRWRSTDGQNQIQTLELRKK